MGKLVPTLGRRIGEEPVGEVPIFRLVAPTVELPASSLLALSDEKSWAEPDFKSGLTARIARAWVTPLPELTGGQVRVLVGQKLGLRWLAAPTAIFLHRHPLAECDVYPGDLMCAALAAHALFLRFAPAETTELLRADFGWMTEEFDFDRDGRMLRDATRDLTAARQSAGLI